MRRLRAVGALCAFLALFLASYHAALAENYGILDDYNDLLTARATPISASYRIGEGRPLDAAWTRLAYSLATDVEHLKYIRFAGIFGVALLAWSVYLILAHAGHRKFQAFCLAAVMGLSLPFQVYAAWATTSNFAFSALLSALAFPLSNRAFEMRRRAPKWSLAAGAVLLLLAGIATYQPSGMFFWVVAAVVLLKADRPLRDVLRRFGWCCMIVSAGMLLAFAASRIGSARSLSPVSPLRYDVVTDLASKAKWFLVDAFPNALNFAWLSVDATFTWTIFIVMSIGLLMHFQGARRERAWKYVVAASILVLSYAPNLLSSMSAASYRTLPAITSCVILYAYFALLGFRRRLRLRSPAGLNFIMGAAATACALSAAHHVRIYLVLPQVRELTSMRSQLEVLVRERRFPGVNAGSVRMTPPRRSASCAPVRRQEFGLPTSTHIPSFQAAALLAIRYTLPELKHGSLVVNSGRPVHDSAVVDVNVDCASPDSLNGPDATDRLAGSEESDALLDALDDARLVVSSEFDVSLTDDQDALILEYAAQPEYALSRTSDALVYSRDGECGTLSERRSRIFLHVHPADANDIPERRRPHGFDNLDFHFHDEASDENGRCVARISLPEYDIDRIRTGAFRTIFRPGHQDQYHYFWSASIFGSAVLHERTEKRIFVRVHPLDANDLPDDRRRQGHETLNFNFFQRAVETDGRFIAQVALPEYDVRWIQIGLYEENEMNWNGGFSPARR